jgi:hypothetical protein
MSTEVANLVSFLAVLFCAVSFGLNGMSYVDAKEENDKGRMGFQLVLMIVSLFFAVLNIFLIRLEWV